MKLKIPNFDDMKSSFLFHTTFEKCKFEKWPHPVRTKTKMDFHVSLGFHEITYGSLDQIDG